MLTKLRASTRAVSRSDWQRVLAGASIAVIALASNARAQSTVNGPPSRDENGVNIISNEFEIYDPFNSFSIGPSLRYDRVITKKIDAVFPEIFYKRLMDWGSYLTIDTDGLHVVGSEMEYFDYSQALNRYFSRSGDKSYIIKLAVNSFVYYAADGRVLKFVGFHGVDTAGIKRITEITQPNGEKLTLVYRLSPLTGGATTYSQSVLGLQTASTNTGHLLHFGYESDTPGSASYEKVVSIGGYNLGTDNCAVGALQCPVLAGRPRLTLQYGTGTVTITNSNGSVSRITTSGSATQTTLQTVGIQFPSGVAGSYDNVTVKISSDGVYSITKDNRLWRYTTAAGPSNNLIIRRVIDPNLAVTQYTVRYVLSDFGNRIYSITDANNFTTSFSYDPKYNLERIVLPEGNTIKYLRDANYNVTERRLISRTPGTPPDIVDTFEFPSDCTNLVTCHQPVRSVDPLLSATDYTYHPTHGGLTSLKQPAAELDGIRPERRIGYAPYQAYYRDTSGTVVPSGSSIWLPNSISECATTANCLGTQDELRTTIDYGPQSTGVPNNLLVRSVTLQSGDGVEAVATANSYDAAGNLVAVDGPVAGPADTTTYRYDQMGRRTGEIGPDPDGTDPLPNKAVRTTINDAAATSTTELGTTPGQTDPAWQAFAPAQSAEVKVGRNGQVETQTVQAGGTVQSVTQYSYDSADRPDCVALRMNPAVFASLPANACTPSTPGTQGADRITKLGYDPVGQVTEVRTATGTGREIVERTAYTPNGKRAYVTDASSNRTTYEYDGHDRLERTRFPDTTIGANVSSTTDFEKVTYDGASRVQQHRLRDGSVIDMEYDRLGRVKQRTPQGEVATTFGYDLQGRVTLLSQANGPSIQNSYDALRRLQTETQPYGSISYAYNNAGLIRRLTWADGFFVDYDYNPVGQITAIRENGSQSGIGVLARYTYNSLGQRNQVIRGNGTVTSYQYDAVSRLQSLSQDLAGTLQDQTIGPITYNPASQMTSITSSNDLYAWTGHFDGKRTYETNGLNQYASVSATPTGVTTAFSYDGRGNLTVSGTSNFTYSRDNRLLTGPGVSLDYDPAGRLARFNAVSSTRFYYAGSNLVAELSNPSGAVLKRYVPGSGRDEPIVWYEGAGLADRRFLHTDERGSITAISDESGSAIVINKYDEFGIPFCPLAGGVPNCADATANKGRFQFTGQVWLPELGMYSYKARVYSYNLGRFMQTDPIGYGDGLNLYSYAANDPFNNVDSDGLAADPLYPGGILVVGRRPYLPPIGANIPNAASLLSWRLPSGSAPPLSSRRRVNNSRSSTQGGHFFDFTKQICRIPLTAAERGRINRATAVPDGTISPSRGSGTWPVGGWAFGIIPLIPGYVTTRFSSDYNIAVNTTTSAHVFVGTIERTIYSNSNGTFIRTTGRGNAGTDAVGEARDHLNETMGPGIFRDQNALARIHAREVNSGC